MQNGEDSDMNGGDHATSSPNMGDQTGSNMANEQSNVEANYSHSMGNDNAKHHDEASVMKDQKLPDTGETSNQNATLLGGLFAALGSIFLFGRRRKDKEEK